MFNVVINNVAIFRISLLMLHYFKASLLGVALFIVAVALSNVALYIIFHYFNIVLFDLGIY